MKQFTLIYAFVICLEQISAQTPPVPFPMLGSYGNDPNFNEVFYDVNEWIRANPLNTEYESEIKFHSRAQYFMEPRLDQTGSMKSYVDNYYDVIRSGYEVNCGEQFIASDWNCIGPHSDALPLGSDQFLGYLQTLWVDPDDENHILVGNNGGGIWESKVTYTNPNEWKYITDNPGFPGMGIRKIAVDPVDKNIIYASTYMRQVLVYQRNYGVGVMYSEDAGDTWMIDEEFLNFINDPPSPILADVPVYLPYTYNIKYLPKLGGGNDLYLPYYNYLLKRILLLNNGSRYLLRPWQ
ncbi:MAG: hypothetical protein IPO24_00100 [Bacteroidetes bacterium]|nr:hypothetical protein [Bacteroidota bacterium]